MMTVHKSAGGLQEVLNKKVFCTFFILASSMECSSSKTENEEMTFYDSK